MLNDRQFRRMFRMSRECFDMLCDKIKVSVGEKAFQSEAYISVSLSYPGHIQNAQVAISGDFVSGKVKLAITIRLIAGGDSYD